VEVTNILTGVYEAGWVTAAARGEEAFFEAVYENEILSIPSKNAYGAEVC
jgi:hypothetical protein